MASMAEVRQVPMDDDTDQNALKTCAGSDGRSERVTKRMKKHTQDLIAEVPRGCSQVGITIGIDLGDAWSHYCTLNEDGEVVDRGRFRANPSSVGKWFTDLPRVRIAMEAGTHSIWISEQLQELGHKVIVANVRAVRPGDQAIDGEGISGNTGAPQGLWSRPAHGTDVCPDSGKQRTFPAKSRCGLLSRPAAETQPVRRARSSARHHQGGQCLPP
jgi:hypothetical protein